MWGRRFRVAVELLGGLCVASCGGQVPGAGENGSSARERPGDTFENPDPGPAAPAPSSAGGAPGHTPPSGVGGVGGGGVTATHDGGAFDGGPGTLDLRSYSLANRTAHGRLIGAYWTGAVEAVDLIDPATGAATPVGTLDGLRTWSNAFVYDDASSVVYAVGTAASGAPHVYSLSLETKESLSVSMSRVYALGGVTDDHRLVAAYWTGGEERVVLVDTQTGDTTYVGDLGDLRWWSDQLVYDPATRTVFAIGQKDTASPYAIYSVSLDTGASTQAPIPNGYTLSQVDRGRIIAATWDGSREPVLLIDPATGMATGPVGLLGDLRSWQGQIAYDPDARVVHAIGQDAADVSHLYRVELSE